MGVKSCNRCGVEKPFEEFHKNSKGVGGRATFCKECRNAVSRVPRVEAGWRGPSGSVRLPKGVSW